MSTIRKLFARSQVIATSALAWASGILVALVWFSDHLGELDLLGLHLSDAWTRVLTKVIAVLAFAVTQMRRVTPVDRVGLSKGLLPLGHPDA